MCLLSGVLGTQICLSEGTEGFDLLELGGVVIEESDLFSDG